MPILFCRNFLMSLSVVILYHNVKFIWIPHEPQLFGSKFCRITYYIIDILLSLSFTANKTVHFCRLCLTVSKTYAELIKSCGLF